MACVTTQDITEMMAFDQLEPFGAMAEEMRFGMVCAAIFNVQRTKHTDPVHTPADFMPALAARVRPAEPTKPQDPEAHSNLLDAALFGKAPK